MAPVLGLISINDVYTLEHLPKLASLIAHHRVATKADRWLVVVAGDFLAPSLLSSVDGGRHMVECLNLLGVTHVTFGNHEDDLSPAELLTRYSELRATWLGTNVRGFAKPLPPSDVVEVGGLRVGLVGGVMHDPTVYRRPPFGGVSLERLNDALRREVERLRPTVHTCLAVTHQWLDDDRALARMGLVPLIIGGHEHDPFLEQVRGTTLSKAGSDATHAAVITIELARIPKVKAVHETVAGFPADPAVQRVVDEARALVERTAGTVLLELKKPLSSKGARSKQTSMGTFVTSVLRDALHADAAVFNGGGLRGTSARERRFTFGDLMEELPFENEIVLVPLPGAVLREAIAFSRRKAPASDGGFLQVDDGLELAADQRTVVSVGGRPLDERRIYRVAVPRAHLLGLDRIDPLETYAKATPGLVPAPLTGRPPRLIVLDALRRAG